MKAWDDALLQDFENNDLKAKIHSNRSLVNYKLSKYCHKTRLILLGNYGRAAEDARAAIRYDPKFIKPYFRGAQAYLILEKFEECVKICEDGLVIDPKCKEIVDIHREASQKLEKLKAKVSKLGADANQKVL